MPGRDDVGIHPLVDPEALVVGQRTTPEPVEIGVEMGLGHVDRSQRETRSDEIMRDADLPCPGQRAVGTTLDDGDRRVRWLGSGTRCVTFEVAGDVAIAGADVVLERGLPIRERSVVVMKERTPSSVIEFRAGCDLFVSQAAAVEGSGPLRIGRPAGFFAFAEDKNHEAEVTFGSQDVEVVGRTVYTEPILCFPCWLRRRGRGPFSLDRAGHEFTPIVATVIRELAQPSNQQVVHGLSVSAAV